MDLSGLRELVASQQREATIEGATFLIKSVSISDAAQMCDDDVLELVMAFYMAAPDDQQQLETYAKAIPPETQKALIQFHRAVLTLGMVNPRLAGPGEATNLDVGDGQVAVVTLSDISKVAEALKWEILGTRDKLGKGGPS